MGSIDVVVGWQDGGFGGGRVVGLSGGRDGRDDEGGERGEMCSGGDFAPVAVVLGAPVMFVA